MKILRLKRTLSQRKKILIILPILFLFILPCFAQNAITGIIRDHSGNPLPGVSVSIKGSSKTGTISSIDGKYNINAPDEAVLVFSYIGMKPQQESVKGRKTIDVTLNEDHSTLNDVVVVGYGIEKKQSLTGAVSSIKGTELLESPSTNVSSLLGGRLPGISSIQTSGEPGNDQANLRVRGSQYSVLYIIDGMPRDINDIDPNDIESISVLKDGASAAVYGLNAAGGVVIVTTKSGKEGKTTLQYDGQFGISVNANFPKFMNGPQYAHYYNMADMMDKLANKSIASEDDYTPVFSDKDIKAMTNGDPNDGWDNVNYIDKVFGTGFNMKHNVSLQGGTESTHYYVGSGYMDQKGNIDNFTYRQYNVRTNIDSKVGKHFSVIFGAAGTIGRRSTPGYSSGGADDGSEGTGEVGYLSIVHQVIQMHPFLPETYNGQYTSTLPNNSSVAYSPLAAIHKSGYKKTRSFELNSNFSIQYDAPWLTGLTLKATGSYDYLSSLSKNLDTPYNTYYKTWSDLDHFNLATDPRGYTTNHVSEGQYNTEQLVGQISAEYANRFGLNNVDAMILAEERDWKCNDFAAYAERVAFAELPELSFGTALSTGSPISSSSIHTRSAGYVFRLKYDYDNTYLAEFSGRYDGSYKFNGNISSKRWGFFPSLSLGWRISNMPFLKNASWIDDLKLRTSIGLSGNSDDISAFSYLDTYSYGSNVILNNNSYSSVYTSVIANPNLTWAKVRSQNIGLDATFWRGKLGIEFDYFYNLNYDLLSAMGADMPPSMGGYYMTYANNNRYDVKGLELTLSHRNAFNVCSKPFIYQINLNISTEKSKWLRYPDSPNAQSWQKTVGTSVGSYSAWIADGIFKSEDEITHSAWYGTRPNVGDIKYKDLNGDGVIDSKDEAITARSNRPQITSGLNLSGSWNGFDCAVLFTGGFKFAVSLLGTYYNGYDDNTIWTQTFKDGANSPLWLVEKSYSTENPNGTYPRLTLSQTSHGGDNGLASTFWMRSGDYVRLKSAQIGYTLPKAWMRSTSIQKVRIFLEGSNLFTLDRLPKGVDPESPRVNNGYYPQQKTYMAGITMTF